LRSECGRVVGGGGVVSTPPLALVRPAAGVCVVLGPREAAACCVQADGSFAD